MILTCRCRLKETSGAARALARQAPDLATLSSGEKIGNPQYLARYAERLAIAVVASES